MQLLLLLELVTVFKSGPFLQTNARIVAEDSPMHLDAQRAVTLASFASYLHCWTCWDVGTEQ